MFGSAPDAISTVGIPLAFIRLKHSLITAEANPRLQYAACVPTGSM